MSPELLQQLRAIHPSAAPSWWPPSVLAIALACGVLLALVGVLYALHRYRRAQQWRRAALQTLHNSDPRELSVLVRRVALHRLPREHVAGLHGDDWQRWLLSNGLDKASAQWLSYGQYCEDARCPSTLRAEIERWLRQLPR